MARPTHQRVPRGWVRSSATTRLRQRCRHPTRGRRPATIHGGRTAYRVDGGLGAGVPNERSMILAPILDLARWLDARRGRTTGGGRPLDAGATTRAEADRRGDAEAEGRLGVRAPWAASMVTFQCPPAGKRPPIPKAAFGAPRGRLGPPRATAQSAEQLTSRPRNGPSGRLRRIGVTRQVRAVDSVGPVPTISDSCSASGSRPSRWRPGRNSCTCYCCPTRPGGDDRRVHGLPPATSGAGSKGLR